jgi:hypothetical protein
MSGPKVVRVVTREEVVARCQGQLARLEAAIAEWTRTCERAHALDAPAAAAVADRRSALQRLLAEDRFAELQKQVPVEIAFLQSDAEARLVRAAAAAAQALQQRRRMGITARMLLEELTRSGLTIPAGLRRDLRTPGSQETAIVRALAVLSPAGRDAAAPSERQRELAASLGGGERVMTLSEWLAAHSVEAPGEVDLEIDHHLAELGVLGADVSRFAGRAAALLDEPRTRQGLLADSLLVELAQAVKEARVKAAQLAALRQCAAELAQLDSGEARDLEATLDAAVRAGEVSSADALVGQAKALIQGRLRAQAAATRRRAVLEGLASLGYEVTEGMATAWVQGGQVVLKKASRPGYGVELAGGTKSDRVQVRAVAFASTSALRDTTRDRDIETLWCSELEHLQRAVAEGGGGIEIERAIPAGATSLKVVEDPGASAGSDEHVPVTRTLQR